MLEALERIQKSREQGAQLPVVPASPAGGPPTDFFASFMPQTQTVSQMGVRKVSLDQIDPWQDTDGSPQPFRIYPEDKLQELAENIRQNGLITPVRLRLNPANPMRYQTLAGHNRIAAAKLIGMTEIDAIVENVDDDTARLIVVDSNLCQREKMLPSEKAFAYKMRLETLKRKAGRKAKNNWDQVGPNSRSAEILASKSEDSLTQIKRYISLTRLLPPLMDMVDAEEISLVGGVALSFLSSAAQQTLLEVMQRENITTISRAQAEELKAIRLGLEIDGAASLIYRVLGLGAAKPVKAPVFRFALDLSPELAKKYSKDEELQRRVAETVRRYIEEAEGENG